MGNRYPQLRIDLDHLRGNAETVVRKCGAHGIDVMGVIKGCTGIPECAEQFAAAGCVRIGSSRIPQLAAVKSRTTGPLAGIPTVLVRIPMLSEVEDVIKYADFSLNSDLEVLRALDGAAGKAGKRHSVILMIDLGDLREGFWGADELVDAAVKVEHEMKNLYLAGVGVNLGCYGSVEATKEKMDELVEAAEKVEAAIGRKLDIISGGATSSYKRVLENDMPERVNELRVGEAILSANELRTLYGCDMSDMHRDAFTIRAEVIEVRDKPSYPVGELGFDAFGHVGHYEDIGIRRKAIVALGKVDYGSLPDELIPIDEGIKILGASSDHTILDITDCKRDIKVGDTVDFYINYAALVFVTNCSYIEHVFV